MDTTSAPAPIPFKKSTQLGWKMIQAEHQRMLQGFFFAVMEEEGLDPRLWAPNVTTMQYEPIQQPGVSLDAKVKPASVLFDEIKGEANKRARDRVGRRTR